MVWVFIAVLGAVATWPVHRWVMHHGGRPTVYGFWLCIGMTISSGSVALATKQNLANSVVWATGCVVGICFSVGFCLVIMYCLRIGPAGPTVAMNNMGMVWPVVLGALWLRPHPINAWLQCGVIMVIVSLICFGFSRPGSSDSGQTTEMSARWVFWAFIGWVFAGISMTAQLIGGIHASDSLIAIVFVWSVTGVLVLLPLVIGHGRTWLERKEVIAGMTAGVLNTMTGVGVLKALRYVDAEVVFPFVLAIPIVLMLLAGQFIYRERLNRLGWSACVFGVVGLTGLLLGQTL